jgi:hypothetical protein
MLQRGGIRYKLESISALRAAVQSGLILRGLPLVGQNGKGYLWRPRIGGVRARLSLRLQAVARRAAAVVMQAAMCAGGGEGAVVHLSGHMEDTPTGVQPVAEALREGTPVRPAVETAVQESAEGTAGKLHGMAAPSGGLLHAAQRASGTTVDSSQGMANGNAAGTSRHLAETETGHTRFVEVAQMRKHAGNSREPRVGPLSRKEQLLCAVKTFHAQGCPTVCGWA